jgi:hypothetical protein
MITESDTSRSGTSVVSVPEGESLAGGVVRATSDATGRPAVSVDGTERELDPLYEAIDPDALDDLFDRPASGPADRITFEYAGCTVTVGSDRRVVVDCA